MGSSLGSQASSLPGLAQSSGLRPRAFRGSHADSLASWLFGWGRWGRAANAPARTKVPTFVRRRRPPTRRLSTPGRRRRGQKSRDFCPPGWRRQRTNLRRRRATGSPGASRRPGRRSRPAASGWTGGGWCGAGSEFAVGVKTAGLLNSRRGRQACIWSAIGAQGRWSPVTGALRGGSSFQRTTPVHDVDGRTRHCSKVCAQKLL